MLTSLLLVLTPLTASAADPVKKGKEGSLKIIATAPWRASSRPGTKAQQMVIRNEEELLKALPPSPDKKAAVAQLARQLKVEELDFSKSMILVVTAGARRTGGYRLEIVDLPIKGKELTVKWKVHPPKGFVTQAFTHPAQAILVPKFEGKVVFDPALPQNPKPGK